MRPTTLTIAVSLVVTGAAGTASAENNGLGITPPMGWNPYNHMKSTNFKWFPNETMVSWSPLSPSRWYGG
jgi:hypothetical protein